MPHIMFGQSVYFKIDPSNNGFRSNGINFANSSGGEFFITEDSDSSYLTHSMVGSLFGASANSLYHNIDRIIWDSRHFNYFEFVESSSMSTLAMSAHTVQTTGGKSSRLIPYSDEVDHTIKTFSPALTYTPIFTLKCANFPTLGQHTFLRYGNHSYRILTPYADRNGIYIKEIYYVADSNVTALTSTDFGTIYYNVVNTGQGGTNSAFLDVDYGSGAECLSMTPTRVKIGTGNQSGRSQKTLFDSDKQYLKKDSNGEIEFFKESSLGFVTGKLSANATSLNEWNCILYHNKNGSVVQNEVFSTSTATNVLTGTSQSSFMGTFQGHTVKYDI